MRYKLIIASAVLTSTLSVDLKGDSVFFGQGENSFEIEFIDIGIPNNPGDSDPRLPPDLLDVGSVPYEYQIARYEVPCSHLNSAQRLGAYGPPSDSGVCFGDEVPGLANRRNILDFVNWLNTSSGFAPAYRIGLGSDLFWPEGDPSYNPINPLRNAGARYFLPTTDEWYKAAFYDPEQGVYYDYATGSDDPPVSVASGTDPGTAVYCLFTPGNCAPGNVPNNTAPVTMAGGLSPFGTMGQLGNGSEWEEEQRYLWTGVHTCGLPNPGLCGTEAWNTRWPSSAVGTNVGFRVVAMTIPEPRFGTWLFVLLSFQVLRRRIRASSPRCAA